MSAAIVITGPQGCGKSRLARAVTRRLEAHDFAVQLKDGVEPPYRSPAGATRLDVITELYGSTLVIDVRLLPREHEDACARVILNAAESIGVFPIAIVGRES